MVVKFLCALSSHLLVWLTIFAFCFTPFVKVVSAQQTPQGDMLGPVLSGAATGSPATAATIFQNVPLFGSGTPIVPGAVGGPGLTAAIPALTAAMENLPPLLQSVLLSAISQYANDGSFDFGQLLSNFLGLNNLFSGLTNAACNTAAENAFYAQNAFAMEIDIGSLGSASLNLGNVASNMCTAMSAGLSPFGPANQNCASGASFGSVLNSGAPNSLFGALRNLLGAGNGPTTGGTYGWTQAHTDYVKNFNYASWGRCGETVGNILANLCLPQANGNGNMWHDALMNTAGWEKMGYTPQNAPAGCILTYTDDVSAGRPGGARNDAGGTYGHVEMSLGPGCYKHGPTCDSTHGGSVPDNFTGAFCCTDPQLCQPTIECRPQQDFYGDRT